MSSDHYSPWLTEQGHAPYAWTVLGAVAQATERLELMTYVTCPTMRYHPAVVAQKAATLHLLSEGRFVLGLGSGENLNEHVVGEGWPMVDARQDMLEEAIHIIRELHTGELVTWEGSTSASTRPASGTAPTAACRSVSRSPGEKSYERFGPLADHVIAVEPEQELIEGFLGSRPDSAPDAARDRPDPDLLGPRRRAGQGAGARAVPVVRRRLGRQRRPADACRLRRGLAVRHAPTRSPSRIPCGPDLDAVVEAVKPFWEAGFTDVALVQVGDEGQQRFLDEAAGPLLDKLRAAAP